MILLSRPGAFVGTSVNPQLDYSSGHGIALIRKFGLQMLSDIWVTDG
jgi:hypothetical protein